jgi:hypothetical protein
MDNQGVALMLLAERLNDDQKARSAVQRIEVALVTMRDRRTKEYRGRRVGKNTIM